MACHKISVTAIASTTTDRPRVITEPVVSGPTSASAQPPKITMLTKISTLLTVCMAIAASSPPVRQVRNTATTANRPMSASTNGSRLLWASAKVTADSTVLITIATTGGRIQVPRFCRIQPRNAYSSAAHCNGVVSSTMIRNASHCSGRGDCGGKST